MILVQYEVYVGTISALHEKAAAAHVLVSVRAMRKICACKYVEDKSEINYSLFLYFVEIFCKISFFMNFLRNYLFFNF